MTAGAPVLFAVVVPTVGRPSLQRLLHTLAGQQHPPQEVVVVDDRSGDVEPLQPTVPDATPWRPRLVRGYGRGPAAARNLGWRLTRAPWVVLLDDDVELPADWSQRLLADLAGCGPRTGASQGRLRVPMPAGRRPTDWERGTRGLQDAAWATADMAYRREALTAVHGFDERFPRAYREDADLALRVADAGWDLARGERETLHPVRPAGNWASLRAQRGNADDALMRRLHGRGWRERARAPRGRIRWHAATTAAAAAAVAAAAARRPVAAGLAAAGWAALTADFAARRIAPGPRTGEEIRRMLLTSVAIPPAACWHRVRGELAHRRAPAWPPPVRAVLFDRDGTLVHDVPYNGDPGWVRPVDGAPAAVRRLRRAGVATGVVSNQSGVARGLLTPADVDAVNAALDAAVGPLDTWQVCPHRDEDGCGSRKPAPGLVLRAARALRLPPQACAVVGDIGADVEAARAAGARGVLVPTSVTRPQEVADAPLVATDLAQALDLLGVEP